MNAPAGHLNALSQADLRKLELKIARDHSGKVPWEVVIWAFANMACWLALWPLVLTGHLSLWIAFPIAMLTVTLVYLPTHEAQHDIIGRKGTRWRWLNELIGHGTSWIIVAPFAMMRYTHLLHHKHTNDPLLDPDHSTHADTALQALWNVIVQIQPKSQRTNDYGACLARGGRVDLMLTGLAYRLVFILTLSVLAWSGYGLEAFFLWWLPLQIASLYTYFYLSWAPHHPARETGRYRDTRSFRSRFGTYGSMWMEYHIIHHLHPYIPLTRTPAAYWDMRPILELRGCNIHEK